MKYKVQWDYQSNIGSFDKGATVEVDDALAEHVNRDSPGVLKPVKGSKAEAGDGGDEAANAGSVDEVLARVGDDAEAAAEILAVEQAEKKPRTTLVQGLEAVIAAEEEEGDGDGDGE